MEDTSGFDLEQNIAPDPSDSGICVLRPLYSSRSGPFRILLGTYFGRRVAIKCLKEEYAASTAHINLLRREGELQASLNHPDIVQAFGVQEIPGIGTAILMEYVEGETLADYLSASRITFQEARRIQHELCAAVGYIHSRGVIHRDLKPENIMIEQQSRGLRIIDFGLSHGSSFADIPLVGGTHNFSAPEQFEKSSPASPAADVWSLGKLMLFLYPIPSEGGFRALAHPARKAWTRTASECMRSDPDRRPGSPEVVSALLDRRIRRYRGLSALATLFALACLCSLIFLGIVSTPVLDHPAESKAMAPSAAADTAASASAVPLLSDSAQAEGSAGESDLSEEAVPSEGELLPTDSDDSFPPLSSEYLNDPAMREFLAFARPVIKKHYRWQLNLLKTLSTQDEVNLALIDHWRWRAENEMLGWITDQYSKKKKISKMEWATLSDVAIDELEAFAKAHAVEEDRAKAAMQQRTNLRLKDSWWEYYRDDLKKVHKLDRSGTWMEYIRPLTPEDMRSLGMNPF